MFNPSKLGTKEYWAQFYQKEIQNFEQNDQDLGEVWFDDAGAESRVINYLEDEKLFSKSILDLGTGNGHMLFSLRESGFEGEMLGIDYVQSSIDFARKVDSHVNSSVKFEQFDILNDEWNLPQYDVVIDKGTLDAICLSGIKDVAHLYFDKIKPMIAKSGFFILTSCNFSASEIINFAKTHNFQFEELEYPKFEFGGQTGSSVVTFVMWI